MWNTRVSTNKLLYTDLPSNWHLIWQPPRYLRIDTKLALKILSMEINITFQLVSFEAFSVYSNNVFETGAKRRLKDAWRNQEIESWFWFHFLGRNLLMTIPFTTTFNLHIVICINSENKIKDDRSKIFINKTKLLFLASEKSPHFENSGFLLELQSSSGFSIIKLFD